MDDRQTEIRAGAGLEDSRINKEFIDFLNKWSSPVIMVIAIAALVWAGLGKLEQMKIDKINAAFRQLQAVTMGGNPSPASLNALSVDFAGIRAVPEIAKLTTADLYLGAFLSGFEPGAQQVARQTGVSVDDTEKLDDGQRQVYLDQADALVQEVIALSESDEGKSMLTMQAMIRAGAIAECRREFDSAKSYYTSAVALAEKIKIPALANFAQMRFDAIDSFDQNISMPNSSELVDLPGEEIPDIPVLPEIVEPDISDAATDAATDAAADAVADEEVSETAPEETPEP